MKAGPDRNTLWESLQKNVFDNEHSQRNKIMNSVCVWGKETLILGWLMLTMINESPVTQKIFTYACAF